MTVQVISAIDIDRSKLFKTWVCSDSFESPEAAGFEIVQFFVEGGTAKVSLRHKNGNTYFGRVMANENLFSKRLRIFALIDATQNISFPDKNHVLKTTEVFLEPSQ